MNDKSFRKKEKTEKINGTESWFFEEITFGQIYQEKERTQINPEMK